ncbi:MAG: GNAT family N-acetyltransferase [Thermoguttaceae bacterium]|nr:GNAT family N-acetyltransferase [Thermoguttaceae bacterium]MDW8038438.1 GNAT family N-acetyltransferase [Thermoguttaceae bacterium]
MEVRIFSDLDTFLTYRYAWDDLWHRSCTVLPTARAELIAHWVEHFAPRSRFAVVAVAEGDQLLAGLPLVERRIKGGFRAADLPANVWAANGELLLDETGDVPGVLQQLCQGVKQLGWPLLWIDMVPARTARWQSFLWQAQQAGLRCLVYWRYPVGLARIEEFACYWASRSQNLQKKVRKALRQLEQHGTVEVRLFTQTSTQQWEEALDQAWQIENASWKGEARTSVLCTPQMRDFYLHQTYRLAQFDFPRLAFLEVASRPIAFIFGWQAKGVFQALKIGYDPAFARFSPGHLLWYLCCQKLSELAKPVTVDFIGPLTDGIRPWANGIYPIGRVIIASNWWGTCFLAAYRAYRTCRGKAAQPDWVAECSDTGAQPHHLLPEPNTVE